MRIIRKSDGHDGDSDEKGCCYEKRHTRSKEVTRNDEGDEGGSEGDFSAEDH